MPMSCSSAATCSSSRSRSQRPCSSRQLVEQRIASIATWWPWRGRTGSDGRPPRRWRAPGARSRRHSAGRPARRGRAARRSAATRRRRRAGAPRFPTAASGRPAAPAPASPLRPPAGGTDRPAALRPAARPRRKRRGTRSRGTSRTPSPVSLSRICEAANRTSPPIATMCVTRLSGISTANLVDDVRD